MLITPLFYCFIKNMNDFVDALKTRFSSPLFGYYSLALFWFNWQAFLYLSMDDGNILSRIKYFEEHTSVASLIWWPLSFSLCFSLFYPWLVFFISWASTKPTELKIMDQVKSESRILQAKKQIEEEQSNFLADAEQNLIERAKRDQELDQFKNEELKARLKQEIENLRTEARFPRNQFVSSDARKKHMELLEMANHFRKRASETGRSIAERQLLHDRAESLEDKAYKLLMEADADGSFALSA